MPIGFQANVNKFSLLSVQDSGSESEAKNVSHKDTNKGKAAGSNVTKKKSKRKKKKEQVNGDQLTTKSMSSLDDFTDPVPPTYPPSEWLKRDEDLVDKIFHDDMWKAIELSKQEYEKQLHAIAKDTSTAPEQPEIESIQQPSNETSTSKHETAMETSEKSETRREKKHKEKSKKTVSLEQFHQQVEETLSMKPDPSRPEKKATVDKVHKPLRKASGSGDFFSNIDKEVNNIQHKEQHQTTTKVLNPSPVAPSPLSLESLFLNERLTEQLNQKDERIQELEDELESWKDKYHHVKKRNQQLLVMLQQGEMKDKAEILLDVERLTVIKDELTNEVTDLHQSLEKERSRVSKLKDELKAAGRVRRQSEN